MKSSAELEQLVFSEQTRVLFARGRIALLANLVNASILVAALWPSVSSQVTIGWLLAMYVTVGLRFLLLGRHRRAPAENYQARRWERRWTLTGALTGALWGLAGAILYPVHWPGGQDLLLFVIGGMVAGASSSMGSYLPAFVAFALPALAPPIVRLTLEHDRSRWAMAALLGIFGIGMTAIARKSARSLSESIRLRFKNARLARDLMSLHEQLLHLNKELEGRVAARTQELERTIRTRDNFVSIVSHELRSPLSSLLLNQEVLQSHVQRQEVDLPQLKRSVDVLSRQLNRMRHIVDDLFDVTRLSTEKMRYDMAPTSLCAIIDDTLEEMSPQLLFHQAEFAITKEEELRGRFDRYRIQQVLVNLMSNALKYGKAPFSLSARRIGERAEIVIRDSGPGIPPQLVHNIFDAFHRGPSSSTAGLGLGLYIAERIVSAHEGTIRVESPPGGGATFIIELPLIGAGER